jgi:hypothetical protein
MFRTAYFLNVLGIHAQFDRLWQKDFASPHLHYFNSRNLKLLFEKNWFEIKYTTNLSYYLIQGLWKRISCKSSFLISICAWLALVLFYPLFALSKDCFAQFAVLSTLDEDS